MVKRKVKIDINISFKIDIQNDRHKNKLLDFTNGDDLIKYLKNNTKKVMAESNTGETINYECPYCNETTDIVILKDGNGRCKKCNK